MALNLWTHARFAVLVLSAAKVHVLTSISMLSAFLTHQAASEKHFVESCASSDFLFSIQFVWASSFLVLLSSYQSLLKTTLQRDFYPTLVSLLEAIMEEVVALTLSVDSALFPA